MHVPHLPRLLAAGTWICVAAISATSHAQSGEPPFDPAIELQLFDYAIGPKSFLTVADADLAFEDQFNVDFLVTFLTDPFTVYDVENEGEDIAGTRTAVVESILAGELSAAYGYSPSWLGRNLQIGLALPLVFSMSGEGLDPATAMPDPGGLQATGFGDLRAEVKARLWQDGKIRLAGSGGLTLPTSFGAGGSDFLGDNLPTLRGRLSFQWTSPGSMVTAGSNLGVILRKPRELYSSSVGQQLTYGAAATVSFADGRVAGIAEVFGRTGLANVDLDASPLELSGGLRIRVARSWTVLAGGGAGVVRGIGSPGLRVFLSAGFAPDYRDSDDDGVVNLHDRCPLIPEDDDGFEDNDGCPDDDNDGDLREDADDRCPAEKEDIDGFQDDDGCPDLDNDEDGKPDLEDRCPDEAEDGIGAFTNDGCPAAKTDADNDGISDDVDRCGELEEDMDGFEDWDGCPEIDNDKDGVPDSDDKCPLCSEDRDGFEDEDGCPERDNDGDGFDDSTDRCPLQAETINGIADRDGCPDKGGKVLAYLQGDRLILQKDLQFSSANRLRGRSLAIIDQVAAVMKAHSEVTQWLVIVAAPKQRTEEKTRAASQKRANVIKAQLLMRGVESARLQAVGAVSDRPRVAIAAKERAESVEGEAFECPEAFKVEPRPPVQAPANQAPATPAPATPAPAPAESPEPKSEPGDAKGGDMVEDLGVTPPPSAATPPAAAPPVTEPGPAPAAPATSPDRAATVPAEFAKYSGVVAGVKFRRNSNKMRSSAKKTLDQVAGLLEAHPDVHLTVNAHTDSRKGPKKSREITQAQSDKVVEYLVDKGIQIDRLTSVGHGMEKPVAGNESSRGRKKNRRIEFVFTVK